MPGHAVLVVTLCEAEQGPGRAFRPVCLTWTLWPQKVSGLDGSLGLASGLLASLCGACCQPGSVRSQGRGRVQGLSQPLGEEGATGQPEGFADDQPTPQEKLPLRPRLLAGPAEPPSPRPRGVCTASAVRHGPPVCLPQVVAGRPKSPADLAAEKPSPQPRAWHRGTGHPPCPRCTRKATAAAGPRSPTACGRTGPHLQVGAGVAPGRAPPGSGSACSRKMLRQSGSL